MEIIDEYKFGYFSRDDGCYSNNNEIMKNHVCNILEKIKDNLPTEDIEFITGCFEIEQLQMMCDPKMMEFNEVYQMEFRYIIYSLINYPGKVNREEFMQYVRPCIKFNNYLDEKIKHDYEYREYIKKLAYYYHKDRFQIEYAMELVNQSIFVFVARIAAYAYSQNLDSKIIEVCSSLFENDYKEIIDTLDMNCLFDIIEKKCTINYFKILLSVISSFIDTKKREGKVIS